MATELVRADEPGAVATATPVNRYDVLIVGAGPVGLYGAYYAGFRGLRVGVVDSLPEPGGQVTAMYPEKLIYDVAGFPAVRGRDLVAGLVEQADRYEPDYLLGRRAEQVAGGSGAGSGLASDTEGAEGAKGDGGGDDDGGDLVVTLSGDVAVHTRALLVTAGMGQFTPKALPAAEDWHGEGVINFVRHPSDLTGQDVVIVGGGDSAFDWALMLDSVARHVSLIHRRTAFRAHAGTVEAVRQTGVRLYAGYEVAKLAADASGSVTEVEVVGRLPENRHEQHTIPATTVIAALGFHADLGPVASWGLALDKRAIAVDTRMATNRSRVYAAGDVCTYPGKVKLIATGFGEAATAINNIAVDLDPSAKVFPGHSSG